MTKEIIATRPLNFVNYLSRPDSSALLSQGETVALVAFFGPIEAKQQTVRIDRAAFEVNFRPKTGIQTVKDRFKENSIKSICETSLLAALYPRTCISLTVLELENRGGFEACAINAACMALLASGMAMKYTVAAVHCIVDKKGEIVVDPNHRQAKEAIAMFTFAFDSVNKNLVACNTEGKFKLCQYNDCQLLAKAASEKVFQFYKEEIRKMHERDEIVDLQ